MIEAYEAGTAPAFELYGLGLEHKHVPELMAYAGPHAAADLRAVGRQLPPGHAGVDPAASRRRCRASRACATSSWRSTSTTAAQRAGQRRAASRGATTTRLAAEALNGTDRLELFVFGKPTLQPGRARRAARQSRQGRRRRGRAEHQADARARAPAAAQRRQPRDGGPRHHVKVQRRGGDHERGAGLMRQPERERHARQQRPDADQPSARARTAASSPAEPTTRSSSAERAQRHDVPRARAPRRDRRPGDG